MAHIPLSSATHKNKRELVLLSFLMILVNFYDIPNNAIPLIGQMGLPCHAVRVILGIAIAYLAFTYFLNANDDYNQPDDFDDIFEGHGELVKRIRSESKKVGDAMIDFVKDIQNSSVLTSGFPSHDERVLRAAIAEIELLLVSLPFSDAEDTPDLILERLNLKDNLSANTQLRDVIHTHFETSLFLIDNLKQRRAIVYKKAKGKVKTRNFRKSADLWIPATITSIAGLSNLLLLV